MRLSLLFAAVLLLIAADAPTTILLREQAWTAPGARLAHDMTHAPSACLAVRTPQTEVGRALFRAPALLGGPAARAGLSCHACHSNGRVNERFLLPELTDRPGTSDVTSEWSSRVRGDGVFNPIPIPDLAGVGERPYLGRARDPSLENFVRGVIVEEFQGAEPPDQALASLLEYLRALEPCAPRVTRVTLAGAADDVRRAVAAAEAASDAPTAWLVLLAAQDGMGRIVERLPVRRFARERQTFETLSREVGVWRDADDVHVALATAAPGWGARFDAAVARVARRERQTYFNEATLRRALR